MNVRLKNLMLIAVIAAAISACGALRPELATLYKTEQSDGSQPPVILVHGAFGGRICDNNTPGQQAQRQEHWPGGLFKLLTGNYQSLALPIPNTPYATEQQPLVVCGLTDTVAGSDFYGDIENTLTGPGGYERTEPGTPVTNKQRRYYRFIYDWRQDNHQTAAKLNALVDQIRIDHNNNALQVDVVAHSMGGLVTRYWLRYGSSDVLSSNDFPINNDGAGKARKVILVGTPNLGSTSALQQILVGADFTVNDVAPEVLLSFPSAYQLLPHPIVDAVVGSDGKPLERDIYDIRVWRALGWGPFDTDVQQRLQKRGWSTEHLEALGRYVGLHLERARRFVWSLTVKNTLAPHELIMFGGDCVASPARILIEDIGEESLVRLWPDEIKNPRANIDYQTLMLEPGDGAVTKASLLARTKLDPSIPRHRYSDFPLDYAVMFCGDHTDLPGNITFQDNLLHILLSR